MEVSSPIPLSHIRNSKVLFCTKLNVNFNTTKVTKSSEPQKHLKGSLRSFTQSLIENGASNGLGAGTSKPCDFPSMNCCLHLAFLGYTDSAIRS